MPKPVITQPATPRTIAQGIAIPTLNLVATNDPDTWTAAPLPAGFSFDAEAGVITGTPTAAGLVETTITATNESGTSDPVRIVWNIQAQPVGAGLWSDLELDLDLVERTVSIPGIERAAGEPIFLLGRGDKVFLLVGARKFGVLRDVNPAAEPVTLKLALKEFEPEILLSLQGGTPTKVGSADATRYRIPIWMEPAAWAVLADYEGDGETRMIPRAELELVVGTPLYDQTKVIDELTLRGDLGGDDYGDPNPIEETLVFDGLTATAGASYTLVVSLEVADRPGQSVSLTQTMTITYTGGAWVVSGREGDDSIQGDVEDGEWRATLSIEAVAGDADSVDVDVSIATSEDVMGPVWEFDVALTSGTLEGGSFTTTTPKRLRLYDGSSAQIGSPGVEFEDTYESAAVFLAAIEAAWQTIATEEIAATAVNESTVRIVAPMGTAVAELEWTDTGGFATHIDPISAGGEGNPAATVLTGQLSQVASAEDQPPRFTAQFPIGVIRDMVPDQA